MAGTNPYDVPDPDKGFDWTAAEAMNTALVPAPAMSQLMSAISE